MNATTPAWEHGYRCHGYWLGLVRWGYVAIHARRFGRVPKTNGYKWEMTPYGTTPQNPLREHVGYENTLLKAKQAVERAYAAYVTKLKKEQR